MVRLEYNYVSQLLLRSSLPSDGGRREAQYTIAQCREVKEGGRRVTQDTIAQCRKVQEGGMKEAQYTIAQCRVVAACNAKPLGLVASGADPGYTNHQNPYCTAKKLKEGFFFTKTL